MGWKGFFGCVLLLCWTSVFAVPGNWYGDSPFTSVAAILLECVCSGGVGVTFHLCSISQKRVLAVQLGGINKCRTSIAIDQSRSTISVFCLVRFYDGIIAELSHIWPHLLFPAAKKPNQRLFYPVICWQAKTATHSGTRGWTKASHFQKKCLCKWRPWHSCPLVVHMSTNGGSAVFVFFLSGVWTRSDWKVGAWREKRHSICGINA